MNSSQTTHPLAAEGWAERTASTETLTSLSNALLLSKNERGLTINDAVQ